MISFETEVLWASSDRSLDIQTHTRFTTRPERILYATLCIHCEPSAYYACT